MMRRNVPTSARGNSSDLDAIRTAFPRRSDRTKEERIRLPLRILSFFLQRQIESTSGYGLTGEPPPG